MSSKSGEEAAVSGCVKTVAAMALVEVIYAAIGV
jgi:hypothetical protein